MLKNKWETMFPVRMKKCEQRNRNYKKKKTEILYLELLKIH